MSDIFIGRWISTADRKPPKNGLYIVKDTTRHESIGAQVYRDEAADGDEDRGFGGWDPTYHDVPEHWLEPIVPSADPACVERVAEAIKMCPGNRSYPRLATVALKALEGTT